MDYEQQKGSNHYVQQFNSFFSAKKINYFKLEVAISRNESFVVRCVFVNLFVEQTSPQGLLCSNLRWRLIQTQRILDFYAGEDPDPVVGGAVAKLFKRRNSFPRCMPFGLQLINSKVNCFKVYFLAFPMIMGQLYLAIVIIPYLLLIS